jgi:MFS family permease
LSINIKKNHSLIGWLICTLGAIFYCYEYILRIAPSVMEAPLRTHFDLGASGFGALSAYYYYAYVPMQLPVGILMDRYGPKRLLTLACLICVLGTFMFAGTSLFWVAALGRFLVGLGSAFAFVGVLKLATIWLPENKLGLVSGLASALGTVGAMLGDNLLGIMVQSMGWQQTFHISAFFGIVLTLMLWYGILDESKRQHAASEGTIHNFKKSWIDLKVILKNKQVWINGLYGCLVYLPATVFAELWGIPYLQHAHVMTENSAHLANSLLFLGFTIGAPLMGLLSDSMERRKPPMLLGAIVAGIIMLAVLYIPGMSAMTIYCLMFTLGIFYSAQCIVFAVSRELSPNEAAGTAMALTNMVVMLGAMFLQPFVGVLLDFHYEKHANFVMTALDSISKMHRTYNMADFQFALSIIPLGIFLAAILVLFLKETYAHTRD